MRESLDITANIFFKHFSTDYSDGTTRPTVLTCTVGDDIIKYLREGRQLTYDVDGKQYALQSVDYTRGNITLVEIIERVVK